LKVFAPSLALGLMKAAREAWELPYRNPKRFSHSFFPKGRWRL
jgi:hypothetical protein